MTQINLSTLSAPELRQMLDSSRRQGDASLSYKVLQEMAARREAAGRRKRRGEEPREFVVELDLPRDDDDEDLPPMPNWPHHAAVAGHEPEAVPERVEEPPLTLAAAAPRERRTWPKDRVEPATTLDEAVAAADPDPEPEPGEAAGLRAHFRSLDFDHGYDDVDDFEPEPEPAAQPRFEAAAAAAPAFEAARHEERPFDGGDLRMGREASAPPPPARKPKKPGPRAPLGFAVGLALGAALGWGVAVYRQAPELPAPVQTAEVTPPPAPSRPEVAPPAPDAAAPVDDALSPQVAPGTVAPAAGAAPAADTAKPIGAPTAVAAPSAPPVPAAPPAAARPVQVASAGDPAKPAGPEKIAPDKSAAEKPVRVASAATGPCAAQPTPADKVICGDAELKRLQTDLRRAYSQALSAHEDRDTLRQRELAWRDARNEVTDPGKLARLYQDRIRKLDAATAEARRLKGEDTADIR